MIYLPISGVGYQFLGPVSLCGGRHLLAAPRLFFLPRLPEAVLPRRTLERAENAEEPSGLQTSQVLDVLPGQGYGDLRRPMLVPRLVQRLFAGA